MTFNDEDEDALQGLSPDELHERYEEASLLTLANAAEARKEVF